MAELTTEQKAAIDELNTLVKRDLKSLQEKAHENGETLAQLVDGSSAAKEQFDKINARMDELEKSTNRPGAPAQPDHEIKAAELWAYYFGEHKKPAEAQLVTIQRINDAKAAFRKYLRTGEERMSPDEVKLLSTQDAENGGYLVQPEFGNEIIKDLTQISPVRTIARVTQTASGVFKVARRTGTPTAAWVGEGNTDSKTNSTYGLEEIPNGTMRATSKATREQLGDSAFNMEQEIRSDFLEAFQAAEGASYVSGNGVGKPEGFMTNASVDGTSVTGSAAAVTFNGLVDVSHGLNANYLANARFVFNLGTLGDIRKLEDTAGQLLFAPAAGGAPSTILGFPYTVLQDMPAVAANAYPVAFGDFMRGYRIIERVVFDLLRDPYTAKTDGAVEFTGFMRVGGQVVLPTAIRKLKCST